MGGTGSAPILEARGIRKRFGGTEALADVDLDLVPGEIHCVIGENGAGKSTFAKIITGVVTPDTGTLSVDGAMVELRGVHHAQQLGISAVYQHPMIFPDLTVSENVFAGRQPTVGSGDRDLPIVSWPEMRRRVAEVLERLGIDLDPSAPMAGLPTATQQLVEIAKALTINTRVLILDEPTASLSNREVSALFRIVRELTADGVAVVFITHRLDEVFELGDQVSVLRDGRQVFSERVDAVDRAEIIRQMVGRSVEVLYPKEEAAIGEAALEVEDLGRRGVFGDVSFTVREGEILGMAGLVGAGRTEVARALFGIDKLDGGRVHIAGRQVRPRSPQQMLAEGLAYLPEDRHQAGLVLSWPIFMNVSLAGLARLTRLRGLVSPRIERSVADRYAESLSIRARGTDQAVADLSGGNQQKVLLAKWLAAEPRVLVLDEPTRGIDVGAKAEVHATISDLVQQGIAVVLISSELPEVLAMSDRVLAFCEGRITGHFSREDATQERVMAAATDVEASMSNSIAHGGLRDQGRSPLLGDAAGGA